MKLGDGPRGDHVTHVLGLIERLIMQSSIWKCSYVNYIIKGGLMMWVSSRMDGNRQEGEII